MVLPAGPPIGVTGNSPLLLLGEAPDPPDDDAQAAMIAVATHTAATAYGLVSDRFSFM